MRRRIAGRIAEEGDVGQAGAAGAEVAIVVECAAVDAGGIAEEVDVSQAGAADPLKV